MLGISWMAPKFRGGSDDWLDDEDSSRNRSGAAKKKRSFASGKAEPLDPALANATVSEVFPKQCRAWMDDGRELACTYRRSAVVGAQTGSEELRERSPVAVGDRVQVEVIGSTDGVIEAACARKKSLLRPAPGREEGNLHVVAANIDLLCIVTAARDPAFSPGLVDRFLIAAALEGIEPVLCINKIDLIDGGDPRPWDYYRQIGVPVVVASARY
jgi:ribosome biogenesis GTPase